MANEIKSFGAKKDVVVDTRNSAPKAQISWIENYDLLYDVFPPGFKFGCGTSATQVEGGANIDGRGPSAWDALCRDTPEAIDDRSSCDITCDSYNQYEKDVNLLKNMGANSYKFSLSWSRILPNGDLSIINQKGIDYYNKLINCLLRNGIEPLVVMWHFDLPEALAKKYSWKDEELIDYFVDYAKICYQNFGDRVKYWMTINEPWIHTIISYDLGMTPPRLNEPECVYIVMHNILKAHALAYRLYESQFKEVQNGKVGISLDSWGIIPADPNSEADKEAAQVGLEFKLGCAAHPLFFGSYPKSMRDRIDKKSFELESRKLSRLPVIDEKWSKIFKGTVDFIGLNHYTCFLTTPSKENVPEGIDTVSFSSSTTVGFVADEGNFSFFDPTFPGSQTWWLKVTPEALRPLLNFIKTEYGNPEVIITENGYPDTVDTMEDIERSNFFTAYMNETLKAVKLDGCNVTGYMAWCLLDGWEWITGHHVTFGIHHVDMNDPNRTRTPRMSAKTLEKIFKNNGFLKN